MKLVRVLMVGDVVGEPGLEVLEEQLPGIIQKHRIHFAVVNGENAADGFGLTESGLQRILGAGADVISSGNHIWEKRDLWPILDSEERVLRPANYPAASPGHGWVRIEKNGINWIMINLQGREFMTPIDCPFRCFDSIFADQCGAFLTLVDFHAESTREKETLAYYLDGRASLVAGTHTHVQTADERILPKGTAYISDMGMTGITSSVIGMDTKICLDRARKQVLYRMEPASKISAAAVHGVIAELDADTGKAQAVWRV